MATTAQRLIVNVETGSLLPSFEGVVGTTQPRYTLGDTTPVEIYLVKSQGALGGVTQVPFPGGATVRMAVGVVNQQPTAGSWSLTWNGDTATGLAYNITPAALQTALNALASITAAGGVTVAAVGNHYQITFNSNGARVDFTAGDDTLTPAAQVGIVTLQQGGVSTKEVVLVNLAVSPIALSTSFTDVAAPSGAYSASAWNLAGGVRGGGYKLQLTFTQGATTKTVWTDTIGLGLSLQDISQYIFNALVNAGWGSVSGNATTNAWGLRVSALDAYSWRVDFTQPNFTTPIAQSGPTIVGIDVTGLTALAGKQGELALATAEAVAYLGNESSKRAVLEIEVEAASDIQTVIQTPCELLGQVIVSGALAPLVGDTPLGETTANNRFVRRDVAQSPAAGDIDIIWPNLGVSHDGSDVAAAISGAVAPAAGNVFVTMSERNPFDQTLNTADTVDFGGAVIGGLTIGTAIQAVPLIDFCGQINFTDSTTQTSAAVFYDQSLNTTDNVNFERVVAGERIVTPELHFSDLTIQTSAPVVSSGTVIHSGGGGHIDALDYPDEIRIVIGGVTYAMPARIV